MERDSAELLPVLFGKSSLSVAPVGSIHGGEKAFLPLLVQARELRGIAQQASDGLPIDVLQSVCLDVLTTPEPPAPANSPGGVVDIAECKAIENGIVEAAAEESWSGGIAVGFQDVTNGGIQEAIRALLPYLMNHGANGRRQDFFGQGVHGGEPH